MADNKINTSNRKLAGKLLLVAIGMFRAAGGFALLAKFLGPLLIKVGFPPELLPLAAVRPFSGGAAKGTDAVFDDARAIRDGGRAGISVLGEGERVSSNAAGDFDDPELTASYLGRSRETGFRVERSR